MKNIFFRCDASQKIGSGHVMRCLNIARELEARDTNIIFLCKRTENDMIEKIGKEFRVGEIRMVEKYIWRKRNETKSQVEYEEEDARLAIEEIKKLDTSEKDWIIVDSYDLGEIWERRMKALGEKKNRDAIRIMVIDDLANRKHYCDILVDQNYYGEKTKTRYKKLLMKKCETLLGPKYGILAKEYINYRKYSRQREEVRKIMIYFGSMDEDNMTQLTIDALSEERFLDIELGIIISDHNPNKKTLKESVIKRGNACIETTKKSIARNICEADMAIGAGGTTTWERACLSLRTIVITIAKNQEELCKELDKSKYIRLVGKKEEITKEEIQKVVKEEIERIKDSKTGSNLIDGLGVKRICNTILNKDSYIRDVEDGDSEILLSWANEIMARKNRINQNKISKEEHEKWFELSKTNESRKQYILIDECEELAGQIRLDYDKLQKNYIIDYSISKRAQGKGLGERMIKLVLEKIISEKTDTIKIEAVVKIKNIASYKCLQNAGFKEIRRDMKKKLIILGWERKKCN